MLKPKDFGDPHPSDIGDVPPVDPTDNFEEVDYAIAAIEAFKNKLNAFPDVTKPKSRELPDHKRDTFSGVITALGPKDKLPRTVIVLCQNLKRVTAVAAGHEDIYSDLRIGDSVHVTAGELANTWILTGSPRTDELPLIALRTQGGIGNNVIPIIFDIVDYQTGDPTILVSGGAGTVIGGTKDQEFLIQILCEVTVECLDPSTAVPSATAQASCLVSNVTAAALPVKYPFKNLRFDKNLGFKVYPSNIDQTAEVTISGENSFYMLYQPSGGGVAVWTNWPVIASALSVGLSDPQAWLILENNAGVHVWLGTGNQNLKYVFPDNAPNVGSHLMIEAVQGEGVKLKHSAVGGRGTMSVYNCYSQCVQFRVEDGLIVSGPGISVPSAGDGTNVAIQPPMRRDYKPCP